MLIRVPGIARDPERDFPRYSQVNRAASTRLQFDNAIYAVIGDKFIASRREMFDAPLRRCLPGLQRGTPGAGEGGTRVDGAATGAGLAPAWRRPGAGLASAG